MPKLSEIERLRKQLTKIVDKIHEIDRNGLDVEPLYPWVLVRVLPKTTKGGDLVLTENHNQVIYEGIVLRTWKPFEQVYKLHNLWCKHCGFTEEQHPNTNTSIMGIPHLFEETISMESIRKESVLKIGDYVLFSHFAGMPCGFLEEKQYRLVKEDTTIAPPDNIIGKYNGLNIIDNGLEDEVLELIGRAGQRKLKTFTDKYLIFPKDMQGRTLSGTF